MIRLTWIACSGRVLKDMLRVRPAPLFICVGLLAGIGACAPAHDHALTDSGGVMEATTAEAPPQEGTTPAPDAPILARVDAWIETELLAKTLPEHGVWGYSAEFRLWGPQGAPSGETVRVRGLTDEEVCMFIEAGPFVVPFLIPHIRNAARSPITFSHPKSSQYLGPRLLVGELACYMIEAAIRGQQCFEFVPQLEFASGWLGDEDVVQQARAAALNDAATLYEQWYAARLREPTGDAQSPPVELPHIAWQSYMGAWGTCRPEYKLRACGTGRS